MKGIFLWATVHIFWVMESWVMKKLLGPNGRAKTEFSLYIFPNNFDALWGKRIYLFIYFYGIELQATVILSRYQYYSTPIRALAGVAESSTMAITFASSSVMLPSPSPSPKPSFGSLKKTTPFLGFSISAANPKPSFPRQSFRVNCQDKAAVVPLDQRWMFEQSEVSGPVRFSLSLSLYCFSPSWWVCFVDEKTGEMRRGSRVLIVGVFVVGKWRSKNYHMGYHPMRFVCA